MIEARGLQKRFGNFQALKGIDINVKKGEIYGFLGHNGAGKSTTMNILTGFSKADAGSCIVNGWDIAKVAHPGDLHLGYLPEEPKFYPWMTAQESLYYLGNLWTQGSVEKRVEELLQWVGLDKAAKRKVGGFSRGMRQRLGMAAALFYDPDLLMLDEPSSALDPEGRSDVLNLILDLKARGKTVFVSTHILSDAERVCDRVGILSQGQMIIEKSLETLLAENVQSIYDIVFNKPCEPEILARIKQLPGIQEVNGKNERLSVWVETPESSGKALFSLFGTADIMVQSCALRRATLEDIFLEEVGKGVL